MLKFKNGKTFPKKPLDEYSFDSVSDNAIRKWVRNFQGNPTKENIIK